MRPFLLDEITGVKNHSNKLIILLKFLIFLDRIRMLYEHFSLIHKRKTPEQLELFRGCKTSLIG